MGGALGGWVEGRAYLQLILNQNRRDVLSPSRDNQLLNPSSDTHKATGFGGVGFVVGVDRGDVTGAEPTAWKQRFLFWVGGWMGRGGGGLLL